MTGSGQRWSRSSATPAGATPARRGVSVGVVDTVPLFRDGIAALFERTPWARLAAHSASQQGALLMVEQVHPDVVLLDSGLAPNGQLIQVLTSGDGGSKIIVVVRDADRNPGYLARSMAAGAHGAVPRTAEAHRMLEAIRSSCGTQRYLDPMLANLVTDPEGQPSRPGPKAGEGAATPARMPLSRREFQVLQLIAEGMENAAIAKVLFLSVETVRTHVKSILRKLSARDRTHAVTIGFRSGLLVVTSENAGLTTNPVVTPASNQTPPVM